MKCRKKTIVVEAFVFAGGETEPGWPDGWLSAEHWFSSNGRHVHIEVPDGHVCGDKGDHIIKLPHGDYKAYGPDYFENAYEKVT